MTSHTTAASPLTTKPAMNRTPTTVSTRVFMANSVNTEPGLLARSFSVSHGVFFASDVLYQMHFVHLSYRLFLTEQSNPYPNPREGYPTGC